MTNLSESLERTVDLLRPAAMVVGLLAVLGPVLVQILREWLTRTARVSVTMVNEKREAPDLESDTRLYELRDAFRCQESSARWNRWTQNSLTFGQYVVGGVLASSFVQASLSKDSVGLLGVLVLVSSLIHQRYRPDIQHRNAKERAAFLRQLTRRAEDDIYAIQAAQPNAKTVHEIRQMVSDGLAKLEALELSAVTKVGNDVT